MTIGVRVPLVWLLKYKYVFNYKVSLASEHVRERVLRGFSIFWVKINNLHLL